jgi:hypothetical protein
MSDKVQVDPYKILGIDRYATMDDIKNAYRRMAKRFMPTKKNEGNQKVYEVIKRVAIKLLQEKQDQERFAKDYERQKQQTGDNDMMYDVDDSQYEERDMTNYLRERDNLGTEQKINGLTTTTHGVPANFNTVFEQMRTQNETNDDEFDPIPTELQPQLTYTEYEFDKNGERRIAGSKHTTRLDHGFIDDNSDMTYDTSKFKIDPGKRTSIRSDKLSKRKMNDLLHEREKGIHINQHGQPTRMEFAHDTSMENIRNLKVSRFDDVRYDTSNASIGNDDLVHASSIDTGTNPELNIIDEEIAREYTSRLKEHQQMNLPTNERSMLDGFIEGEQQPLTISDIESRSISKPRRPLPQRIQYTRKQELDIIRRQIMVMDKKLYEMKKLYNQKLAEYNQTRQ